jgi:integrase
MANNDMLDTTFLFQPRGQGTGWCFRMATPSALIGQPNPRTGRPYGREIREGMNTRDLSKARKLRDLLLGKIRLEEGTVHVSAVGSMETALAAAAELRALDDPAKRDEAEWALINAAEQVEKVRGEKQSIRWYKTATGKHTPFVEACEQYKGDGGKGLSLSTINNLSTAIKEFCEFAGKDVALEDVDGRMVARFITEFLPNRKGPKAPNGQGPATIRKKVSQLSQVWAWARKRHILERGSPDPWHDQAPDAKEVKAAADVRRPFTPEETRKLLGATHAGDSLGDIVRVALLTGVRLEEVASLEASQVDQEARWYTIHQGKTDNAARVVPLVGMAQEVIKARLGKVNGSGPLFGEVPLRKSTGKRGGALSQAFTRLRREVLGEETDGELAQHCFRHTWRTAAGRAGVDLRTAQEMGGWSRGRASDLTYDHGKELEHYREEQAKVALWLKDRGYLGK